ncbi:MAG: hypothetical protein AMJ54_00735 [Deltaproteobacteria bacterium SG8_13]|nr:MAG: hypothetical protein AMJ54_00735 [Deltaproteobacteria bacterium SG8_13]
MKIYTGGGDRGKTGLFSGERVAKCNLQVETYGDVDELNSTLGSLSAALPEGWTDIDGQLRLVQADLFHIGAWLAITPAARTNATLEEFTAERVLFLEKTIDAMEEQLPALSAFILPGGHASAAAAHVSRAVCRRAERRVVALMEQSDAKKLPASWQQLLRYLNRLSDYLFVLARFCNHRTGVEEPLWKP